LIKSRRWQRLVGGGARTERARRARTSPQNAAYPDLLYVHELIGEDTVNTIPPATFRAFREHGRLRASLAEDVDAAYDTLQALERAGVSLDAITDRLLNEGIDQFVDAFGRLLHATACRIGGARGARIDRQTV